MNYDTTGEKLNKLALWILSKDRDTDRLRKVLKALKVISEMPCIGITEMSCTEDSCAACYAKKVMEGGE